MSMRSYKTDQYRDAILDVIKSWDVLEYGPLLDAIDEVKAQLAADDSARRQMLMGLNDAVIVPTPEVCPTCRKMTGYRNVGRSQYGHCEEHKVYWHIGDNVFSTWRDEDKATWEANMVFLQRFRRITQRPTHAAAPAPEDADAIRF